MSKRKTTSGITSVSLPLFVQDTTSTTGAGLSGLVYNTSNLVAEYRRQGQSAWTAITLVAGTLGTYTSGGIIADGALAGAYEFCPPNAAFASGARWVQIRLRGATNMLPCLMEFELDAVDYQDSVRAGLSALPNANAGAAGGLLTDKIDFALSIAAIASVKSAIVTNTLTVGTDGRAAANIVSIAGQTASAPASGGVAFPGALSSYAGGDTAGVGMLLSRLTATRAGYLDAVSTIDGKIGNFGTGSNSLQRLLEYLLFGNAGIGGDENAPTIAGRGYDEAFNLGGISANIDSIYTSIPGNFNTLIIGTGANEGKVTTSNPATGGGGGGATAGELRTAIEPELTRVMTALPNAQPAAAGGLLTRGTGAGQINATGAGKVPATLAGADLTGTIAGSLADKTGFSLTAGNITAIANEVEAQIIDDTDSEKVLKAITDKIASVNPSLGELTLNAIASAVKTAVEAAGGSLSAIKTRTDNLPADPASATQVATRLAASAYTAPTPPPTANQNAAAVWVAGGRTLSGAVTLPNPAPAGYGGGTGGGGGGGDTTIVRPVYCGDDYPRERFRLTSGDANQYIKYQLRGDDGEAVNLSSAETVSMLLIRRGQTVGVEYDAQVDYAEEGKTRVLLTTVPAAGDYEAVWRVGTQTFPTGRRVPVVIEAAIEVEEEG